MRSKIDALLSDHRLACREHKNRQTELVAAEDRLHYAEEAVKVVQHVGQTMQQEAHKRIAAIVTRCLSTVFDDPYEFVIEFERKRNRTEAVLLFKRDGVTVDPMTASGGGVVDVASFALRLASLILSKPQRRRLLVLDEPFRFLSSDYHGRVRTMLERMAEEMDVQIIMVTHIEALKCGKVVEVS